MGFKNNICRVSCLVFAMDYYGSNVCRNIPLFHTSQPSIFI